MSQNTDTLERVIIKFAGDSGDGMQLTGTQFTNTAALFGNDISTFPDFPAEIRAPAGTLAGVSGFQVNLANSDIFTPGDAPDVLVAMNPAALAAIAKAADGEPEGTRAKAYLTSAAIALEADPARRPAWRARGSRPKSRP